MTFFKDKALPPLKWPLRGIVQVHPVPANVVHVVIFRTSTGVTYRAINKLSLLQINN